MPIFIALKKKLQIIYQSSNLIAKLALIDQMTKCWFIAYLPQKMELKLKITSFLEIVYCWNHGMSFGILKKYHQYSNAIFMVLNSFITYYLWLLMLRCKTVLPFLGYSCVISGAISNIIDRIFRGAVFDFIYFHYGDYGFPVFNLADSFISIGTAVLIYDYYKPKKSIDEKGKSNYDNLKFRSSSSQIRQTNKQN